MGYEPRYSRTARDPAQVCGITGLHRTECYHCPLPGPNATGGGPVSTSPVQEAPATPEALAEQTAQITERTRARLLERKGTEWWAASYSGRCVTCGRRYEPGEPIRFLYGRSARDMSEQGWCCESMPQEKARSILSGKGITLDVPEPEPLARKPKPHRGAFFG